jgi:Ser/Thr protein kinase RdoA (MazF antagonist)
MNGDKLTDHDWLQIEQAAAGCIDGTSDQWPSLRAAIQKITGRPFGPRKMASWMQGFCEGVLLQRDRLEVIAEMRRFAPQNIHARRLIDWADRLEGTERK